MQIYWTVAELMVLSRRQLCELYYQIANTLAELDAGSVERNYALISLSNIRKLPRLRSQPPGPH
jgi:hypothetical protein